MKFVKKVKKFVNKKKLVAKALVFVAVVKFLADFVDVVDFLTKLWEFIQHYIVLTINMCSHMFGGGVISPPLSFYKQRDPKLVYSL